MSIFDKFNKAVEESKNNLEEHRQKEANRLQKLAEAKDREALRSTIVPTIKASTSVIQEKYKVIDIIFAFDSHEPGAFSSLFGSGGAKPGSAFDRVTDRLRNACFDLGGDAVISCQFEYRFTSTSGFFGTKPMVEIYAYGTAVIIEDEK